MRSMMLPAWQYSSTIQRLLSLKYEPKYLTICWLSHSFRICISFLMALISERLVAERIFIAYKFPVFLWRALETDP